MDRRHDEMLAVKLADGQVMAVKLMATVAPVVGAVLAGVLFLIVLLTGLALPFGWLWLGGTAASWAIAMSDSRTRFPQRPPAEDDRLRWN